MKDQRAFAAVAALKAAALIGAVAATYADALDGPFVFDDITAIVENPSIRRLWPLTEVVRAPRDAGALAGRPLVSVSLAVTYAASGLDPRGYHAFSIAVHVACALLLWQLVRMSLARRARGGLAEDRETVAAAVAAVWCVHPLLTEPVAYAIQRTELLMAALYLATLICAARSWSSSRPAYWQAGAVGACAMGMATKEVMATAPLLVVAWDRCFAASSWREALRRRGRLYAALAATWLVLVALLATGEQMRVAGVHSGALRPAVAWASLMAQSRAVVHYLRLAVWPSGQVIVYDWPAHASFFEAFPQNVLLTALAAAALLALVRGHWSGFLGAWFFLILAPSSSVLTLPTEVMAERRMYLPLAAISALAVLATWRAAVVLTGGRHTWRRRALGAMVLATCVALAAQSRRRLDVYDTELALWSDAVAKSPGNMVARNSLGIALTRLGRADEALAQFREAVRVAPTHGAPRQILAMAFVRQGRLEEALALLDEAVRLEPAGAVHHFSRGLVLSRLSRPAEAAEALRIALRLQPDDAEAQRLLATAQGNVGALLARRGQWDEAERHLREALRLRPDYALAHLNLAALLERRGRAAEAVSHYERALRSGEADVRADASEGLRRLGGARPDPPR